MRQLEQNCEKELNILRNGLDFEKRFLRFLGILRFLKKVTLSRKKANQISMGEKESDEIH